MLQWGHLRVEYVLVTEQQQQKIHLEKTRVNANQECMFCWGNNKWVQYIT